MPSIKLLAVFLLMTSVANAKLPELKTKQALTNIRFITSDGKYTYYQQNNGDLQLSTNYSNELVIKGKKNTSYSLYSSPTRAKILIEEKVDFHKNLDFSSPNKIFIIKFGDTKPDLVGEGIFPKLHIKDTWMSYFQNKENKIIIKSLISTSSPLTINLGNTINPYFIPEVVMPSPDSVFYTDINDKGYMALLMYSFIDKKFTPVYKAKFPGMKIEICFIGEDLYIGEFSYNGINKGSTIYKLPIYANPNFQKISTIYKSELDDIGNMVNSKNQLYFIKAIDFNKDLNITKSEVAKFDISTNKIEIISDLNYVTNIINMDQNILIPFRNKYYVVSGKNLLNDDELQKKLK